MPELDIKLKQYLREFLEVKMYQARGTSKNFGVSPGIIVRDTADRVDFEMFLDEMWVFISQKNLNEHNQS